MWRAANRSILGRRLQKHGFLQVLSNRLTESQSPSPYCISSKSSFHETLRLYSSNPSSHSQDSEDDTVLSSEGSSVFYGNEDNVAADEVVVAEVDLEKLLSLLQSSGTTDKSIEASLEELDFSLNEECVVRVLETPYVPGQNLISFFKWALTKPEFSLTRRPLELLVTAVCLEGRNAYALWDLLKEVGAKDKAILTTDILNQLIALLSTMAKGKASFEIFTMFDDLGCVPNADTYYFTIEALCRRSIYDWASSVCENMLNADMLPGALKVGNIISLLCKGNKSRDAHLVYLSAKEKNIDIPAPSIKLLISSLCRKDETIRFALEMLKDFPKEERKHAIKSFSSVIQGLCRAKGENSYCSEDIQEAENLLLKKIDAGPPPGNAVFNTVINALSKSGEMGKAKKLLKMMEDRGLKPDVYTYTVIMSGYVKGGEMEEAHKILDQVKKKHSKLTPVTYHTIIRGHCKLEQYDKALELLKEMKDYGVQPNVDEYDKLIQSLCLKTLDWTKSEKLLEEMKENGLHLNAITKGLVRAVKELEQEQVEVMTAA